MKRRGFALFPLLPFYWQSVRHFGLRYNNIKITAHFSRELESEERGVNRVLSSGENGKRYELADGWGVTGPKNGKREKVGEIGKRREKQVAGESKEKDKVTGKVSKSYNIEMEYFVLILCQPLHLDR